MDKQVQENIHGKKTKNVECLPLRSYDRRPYERQYERSDEWLYEGERHERYRPYGALAPELSYESPHPPYRRPYERPSERLYGRPSERLYGRPYERLDERPYDRERPSERPYERLYEGPYERPYHRLNRPSRETRKPVTKSSQDRNYPKYFTDKASNFHDYHKQVLTEAEADAQIVSLSTESLHAELMSHWKSMFSKAKIDAASPQYLSWLSYFIQHDFGYGTVHAWAKALIRSPDRFILTPYPSEFGLLPVCFDKYGDVVEGCSVGGEPELDREGNIIVRDDINCVRRVWDVCANRIIPRCWVPQALIEPISHAWVHTTELEYKWSSINNKQWAVPLPRGVDLESVRKELINYGIEYSWLDVLCLRQIIPPGLAGAESLSEEEMKLRERKRVTEWEVDVPLIGSLYATGQGKVVVYLNGLGKPYQAQADWTDERHWLRRAWTLQETVESSRMAIAGLQSGIVHPLNPDLEGTESGKLAKKLYQLASETSVLQRVRRMSLRCASNPVDKISGLFFVFVGPQLLNGNEVRFPKYNESATPGEAWNRLVHALANGDLDKLCENDITFLLLKYFPHPSSEYWFPSWEQVIKWPDVSHVEEQRPDRDPPRTEHSLRLKSGRIFFGCTLSRREEPSKLSASNSVSYSLHLPFAYHTIRIVSWWLKPLAKVKTGNPPETSIIDGKEKCVLICLGPPGSRKEPHKPLRSEGIVIVCRDISKFRSYQGQKSRVYLRRVTTLGAVYEPNYPDYPRGYPSYQGGGIVDRTLQGEDIANCSRGAIYLE